jgi:hypothetical protein
MVDSFNLLLCVITKRPQSVNENMRKFLLIMIFGLSACGQSNLQSVSEAPTKDTISKTDSPEPNYLDSIPTFQKTVYNTIDTSALSLMKQLLPDWELPDPSNWEKFWFKEYMKNGNFVVFISGDFNCDDITDYVFLLQNKENDFAVWILQSEHSDFSPIKLYNIGKRASRLDIGIELVPKGRLFYIDFENDNPPPITLKCPGIQIVSFERAASTYYWDNGIYKTVITGD